jgi:hypothetical protein
MGLELAHRQKQAHLDTLEFTKTEARNQLLKEGLLWTSI